MAEVAAKQRKHKMSRLEKKNTLIAYSFGEIRVIGNVCPIETFLLRDLLHLINILEIG